MEESYFTTNHAAKDGGMARMHITRWGKPTNPPLICVHPLTYNNRFYDYLAQELATDFYVLCPSMPGRGNSSWFANPYLYRNEIYASIMQDWLASEGLATYHWVGSSMGGLIALNMPQPEAFRSLVLNDIGAFIDRAPLQAIADRIAKPVIFPDFATAVASRYEKTGVCGAYEDAWIEHLARTHTVRLPDGRYTSARDHDLALPFIEKANADYDLWAQWERFTTPTLILRGALSDILTAATLQRMQAGRQNVQAEVYPNIGHLPLLMASDQITLVKTFVVKAEAHYNHHHAHAHSGTAGRATSR